MASKAAELPVNRNLESLLATRQERCLEYGITPLSISNPEDRVFFNSCAL